MFEGETNITPNCSVTRLASSNYYTFTAPERFGLSNASKNSNAAAIPKRMQDLAERGDCNRCC
jgi:hypothetical protein